MIVTPQTLDSSRHSPPSQGSSSSSSMQQASSPSTTRVSSSGLGMFQRVSSMPSSRTTVPGSTQSWVTLKMMSGVQSHHGYQGYHGHRRSCRP